MRKKMDDKQREVNKNNLLNCAKSIVENEGFEAISIRKVAKLAGYTEGSVYNYFDNKDDLISALIQLGYHQIMKAAMIDFEEGLSIEDQIIQRFVNYTKAALEMPEYYKAIMLSEDPTILEMTSVLNTEGKKEQKGIQLLENLIKKGMATGELIEEDHTLIARVIWTANFGLILRHIIENHLEEEEVVTSVERQLRLLFKGLKRRR